MKKIASWGSELKITNHHAVCVQRAFVFTAHELIVAKIASNYTFFLAETHVVALSSIPLAGIHVALPAMALELFL